MADFKQLLRERRAWYKTIGKVHCPILNEDVVFNSKGFYHLRYDGAKRERKVKEQMYKLGLLPLVIPVIANATRVVEYKKGQYSERLDKYYEIWELNAIVGQQNTSVTVVLRRIGTGNITFLSVWKKQSKTKKP